MSDPRQPASVTIKVPGHPDHYIEVSKRGDIINLAQEEVGSLHRLKFTCFDEVRIVRGALAVRILCDSVSPSHVPAQEGFDSHSKMIVDVKDPSVLEMADDLELQMHLSTPLAAMDCGVWVRLSFVNKNGLQWRERGWKESCQLVLVNDDPQHLDETHEPPPWFTDPNARWTAHIKNKPALGNTLLSHDSARDGLANLLAIDPQRKANGGGADFSLVLQNTGGFHQVCTELQLAPPFALSAAISGYALRLHADQRASAPFSAKALTLRCLQHDARDGCAMRWTNLPGAQALQERDALTLESLSASLLNQHAPGLGTVRARSRLSFVPTSISTTDPTATVTLYFEVAADTVSQRPAQVRLQGIELTPLASSLRLHCAGAVDARGDVLQLQVQAVLPADPMQPPAPDCLVLAGWQLSARGQQVGPIGIGSVLLTPGTLVDGELLLAVSTAPSDYGRGALITRLRMEFDGATYSALSMDPEIGFETLSAEVSRERPWAFDLTSGQTCHLQIIEQASQQQSRLLHLELKMPQGGERRTDVVLIDPSPLTIARLYAKERQKAEEILAEYADDADQAPEWRFYSFTGEMTAILPPQGLGEEMVKGNLHLTRDGKRVRVPADKELFDFRLTPVARLLLDRTDVDTARSEAPWSLRRLLGRRTGTTGVKLDRAEFELLYGMPARLETPGLRIAELDGFIGRIPYSSDLRRARERQPKSEKGLQAADAVQWIASLWHRPSWWRVYADYASRDRLFIDSGLQYSLRPTRQTAHPFEIGDYATAEGRVEGREPLRGGIDWPFQSRNVYAELEPDKPTSSSSGNIAGLVFGPLGGEGMQTAAFNHGKTLIITNSRQGRIDSLTLIRVGRIAMLWNRARHVIVYERTTKRPGRYEGPLGPEDDLEVQPEFDGLAALRKVREYVEITEPRRAYPDSRAVRPISGPLTQSVFNTTMVPVRSDWGRDVLQGFVIALRGAIPPGKEKFFPDPQAFLDFARAPDKGPGAVGQRITNTQQLLFFTSTRAEDTGETDLWPAWPDVDFPLVRPAPVPQLPFASSFAGVRRQPDAAPVELGMGPFTFALAPAEEAANVMHARPVKGLETRLFNINLARGLPAATPAGTPQQASAMLASQHMGEAHSVLLDGLAELRNVLAQKVQNAGVAVQATAPQLSSDVKALLDRLLGVVGGIKANMPLPAANTSRDWAALQANRLKAYQDGVAGEVARLQEQLRSAQLASGLEAARASAAAMADMVCKQAQQRLGEVGFTPSDALDGLKRGLDASAARMAAELEALVAQCGQLMDDLQRRLAKDAATAELLDGLWRDGMAEVPVRLRMLAANFVSYLEGEIGHWFSRMGRGGSGNTIYTACEAGAAAQLEAAADWLARWVDAIAPFDLELPDFAAMRADLQRALSVSLADTAVSAGRAWLGQHLPQVQGWFDKVDTAVKQLEQWEESLAARIRSAASVGDLQTLLNGAANDLDTNLRQAAAGIATALTDEFNQLPFLDIQGELESLSTLAADAKAGLDVMATAVANAANLAQLEQVAREQSLEIERRVQAAGRQVEDWVRREWTGAYAIAATNIDSGLEALRLLATGPVTAVTDTSRQLLGYYMHNSELGVGLTRASAFFNELGGDLLNPLSLRMPFDRLTDRLKASIGGMMVRDLFPRIAGIDMTYLLPDLKVPLEGDEQFEWLRLRHGFDVDHRRAWAKVDIDKRFDTDATLFDLGPVKLRLLKPRFWAQSDLVVGEDQRRTQKVAAFLEADFEMSLNGRPMVTLRQGKLNFDETGHLDFQLDANQVEMAAELEFITNAIKAWKPNVGGFELVPLLPGGVSSSLTLPMPDIGTGAFTLTGVTLHTHIDLRIAEGFEITAGLWLSKPERPFGLAILFLGGGGWFGIDATYRPPSRFLTRVSIGISAGAFIALEFGFAAGSAGLLFTASVDFYRDWQQGTGSTAISVGLLIWGEFSVLGIASASMRLHLVITYTNDGGMEGRGNFSVSIKICWCYTLRVNRSAYKRFSGGSRAAQGNGNQPASSAALLNAAGPAPRDEVHLAVSDFLKTLAIVSP